MSVSTPDQQLASEQHRQQAGYTALEFLAAFTVLVLFLTAGLTAVGVAIRSDHQASFLTTATALARSKLAAAGIDFPLRPGVVSGNFDNGYSWRAEVRRYRTVGHSEQDVTNAFWVEVTVAPPSSNGRRFLSLGSIELARVNHP
jgi:hypothetical protein